jgi:hypothetical protein
MFDKAKVFAEIRVRLRAERQPRPHAYWLLLFIYRNWTKPLRRLDLSVSIGCHEEFKRQTVTDWRPRRLVSTYFLLRMSWMTKLTLAHWAMIHWPVRGLIICAQKGEEANKREQRLLSCPAGSCVLQSHLSKWPL